MKYRYIGDSNGDGPDVCSLYGVDFPKGEPVEATDEALLAKLAGNSYFEEVKGGNHKGRSGKKGAGKAVRASAYGDAEFDGSSDGG